MHTPISYIQMHTPYSYSNFVFLFSVQISFWSLPSSVATFETIFLHCNRDLKLKTQFLSEKQDVYIANEISRLESQFLGWKEDIYIGNEILRLETQLLDWKRNF